MTYVRADRRPGRPWRSWHCVLTPTRMFDTFRTRCGRTVVTKDTRNELPAEKSCESCLALTRRDEDRDG